jgi:hypothetical protein
MLLLRVVAAVAGELASATQCRCDILAPPSTLPLPHCNTAIQPTRIPPRPSSNNNNNPRHPKEMRIIAHRANTRGSVREVENTPAQIDLAITKGYWVEVDVWVKYPAAPSKDQVAWWLGHDGPEHQVDLPFLQARAASLYCHAKNGDALYELLRLCRQPDSAFTLFTHDVDEYTLTSDMVAWVYPGKQLLPGSICVMPERAAVQVGAGGGRSHLGTLLTCSHMHTHTHTHALTHTPTAIGWLPAMLGRMHGLC